MKVAGCIFGLLAILGLRAFLQDRYRTVAASVTAGNAASCLTMLGNTTRETGGSTYIVGSIKNDCDRKIGQATIVFKADGSVDSNLGRREAILYAYERDLEPGETRQFKTMFPIQKNAAYRFDEITAF